MDYQKLASVHAAMTAIRNEVWGCDCRSCKRARKEGYAPQITERIELIALIVETGEDNLTLANRLARGASDENVRILLSKKRQRLAAQMETEKSVSKNQITEANEKDIKTPYDQEGQTAGGGRRIIKNTRSL